MQSGFLKKEDLHTRPISYILEAPKKVKIIFQALQDVSNIVELVLGPDSGFKPMRRRCGNALCKDR